jgi:hypothetical protein
MGTSSGLRHCGEDLAEQLVNRTHQRRLFTSQPAHKDWRTPAWLVEEPVADIAGAHALHHGGHDANTVVRCDEAERNLQLTGVNDFLWAEATFGEEGRGESSDDQLALPQETR